MQVGHKGNVILGVLFIIPPIVVLELDLGMLSRVSILLHSKYRYGGKGCVQHRL